MIKKIEKYDPNNDDLKDELLFAKQHCADQKLEIQSLKVRLLKMEEAVRIKDNQIEYLMDPKNNPKLGQMISGKAINIIMELRRRNKQLKRCLVEQEITLKQTNFLSVADDEEKECVEGTVDEVNSNFLNDSQSHLSCKSPESNGKLSLPQEDEDSGQPGYKNKTSITSNVIGAPLKMHVSGEGETAVDGCRNNFVDSENQKTIEDMSKERDLILKVLVEKDEFNQSLIYKLQYLEKLVRLYSESLYRKCNCALSKEMVYRAQQVCKGCNKSRKNSPERNQRESFYLKIDKQNGKINEQKHLSPDWKFEYNNSSFCETSTGRPNSDSRKGSVRSLASRFGKKYFQNLAKVYSVQNSFGENNFNRKCRSASYKRCNLSQESKKIKKELKPGKNIVK